MELEGVWDKLEVVMKKEGVRRFAFLDHNRVTSLGHNMQHGVCRGDVKVSYNGRLKKMLQRGFPNSSNIIFRL